MGEFIGKQSKINNALLQVLSSIRNGENSYAIREIESRKKDLESIDFQIGHILSQASSLQCSINELLKRKTEQEFMISICEKTKETGDWCGYIEEEHYGIRPEVAEINIESLNKNIVLGYLAERVSPALLIALNEELKREQ